MTLHYHGLPITPAAKMSLLGGCCFCVSYAAPGQVEQAHEIGQSVMLDNGAFSFWRDRQEGRKPRWRGDGIGCSARRLGPIASSWRWSSRERRRRDIAYDWYVVIDPDITNVRMGDLRHGMETPWYEVVGNPQRRADGSVLVPVRHFADPWGTHFVRGDAEDLVPIVASEQLTITHDALPFEGACPHCGSSETDGSPCPWSLVCPLCQALPGDPCRRPTGHLEQVMHEDRVRAAEGRG